MGFDVRLSWNKVEIHKKVKLGTRSDGGHGQGPSSRGLRGKLEYQDSAGQGKREIERERERETESEGWRAPGLRPHLRTDPANASMCMCVCALVPDRFLYPMDFLVTDRFVYRSYFCSMCVAVVFF